MNEDHHETVEGSATATFIHREMFHLKQQKVGAFRACLDGEYTSSSSRPATSDFGDRVDTRRRRRSRGRGRGRNRGGWRQDEGSTVNGSIIELVRQMNGCYSFDIYCRLDNPLKEIAELSALLDPQDEDKNRESSSLSDLATSTSASAIATARASTKKKSLLDSATARASNETKSLLDSTTARSEPFEGKEARSYNERENKGMTQKESKDKKKSGAVKPSNSINVTDDVRPTSQSAEVVRNTALEKNAKTKSPENASDEKDESSGQFPHQFMVMGRWENRNAHEAFFIQERVQHFFCPLISHKVIESLPILTMWKKENGLHHRMHGSINEDVNSTSSGHFVVTRRRTLKDSSNSEKVVAIVKDLAFAALKEKGCSLYEICTTGHPDFNQGEILEVIIWDSWGAFVSFASESYWRKCNSSLEEFFENNQQELLCWMRPTDASVVPDGTSLKPVAKGI